MRRTELAGGTSVLSFFGVWIDDSVFDAERTRYINRECVTDSSGSGSGIGLVGGGSGGGSGSGSGTGNGSGSGFGVWFGVGIYSTVTLLARFLG